MKKIVLILTLIISVFLLRESSSVDEYEAREEALNVISKYRTNSSCGGNFEKYLILNEDNPLDGSGILGVDKSGYTFESNNGRCTVIIYIYKYWGGFEYSLDPHGS